MQRTQQLLAQLLKSHEQELLSACACARWLVVVMFAHQGDLRRCYRRCSRAQIQHSSSERTDSALRLQVHFACRKNRNRCARNVFIGSVAMCVSIFPSRRPPPNICGERRRRVVAGTDISRSTWISLLQVERQIPELLEG